MSQEIVSLLLFSEKVGNCCNFFLKCLIEFTELIDVNPSGTGAFCFERLYTDSVSLVSTGLFRLSMSFGRLSFL